VQGVIYPSIYEGFGLPPLEALACGAAVIAGRIEALQRDARQRRASGEPLDVDALARNILELLQDERQRLALASAGPAQAAKFSWAETARLTLEVYRRLVREKED